MVLQRVRAEAFVFLFLLVTLSNSPVKAEKTIPADVWVQGSAVIQGTRWPLFQAQLIEECAVHLQFSSRVAARPTKSF